MVKKLIIAVLLASALGLPPAAIGGNLDDKIRAAGSDLKVLCAAGSVEQIQWTALLYLNQTYGAEVYVAALQPAPLYARKVVSSPDGQFHLAQVGWGADLTAADLGDSIIACLFAGGYPDVVLFGAASANDSLLLTSIISRIYEVSHADTTAPSALEKVFLRGPEGPAAAFVLNDFELYGQYSDKVRELSELFGRPGPASYTPDRYRWYYRSSLMGIDSLQAIGTAHGFDSFRLPEIVAVRLTDGPEKDNLLARLNVYITLIQGAQRPGIASADRLNMLLSAYQEITRLTERVQSGVGQLAEYGIGERVLSLAQRSFQAVLAAIGVEWEGHLEIRDTPLGKTGRLSLDLAVTGPSEVELSHFAFRPRGGQTVTIDSIGKTIYPHQRFYRQYPVDLKLIDFGATADSSVFSLEIAVGGMPFSLDLPYTQGADRNVSLRFLPGYAFLPPFTEDQLTALAQPFDWQLLITKPYAADLSGQLRIDVPDGIVVGSFDDHIVMPAGITSKYMDIHLAAGRSVGPNRRTVRAFLDVSGQTAAETGADVQVVRCEIPDTRDIAFVPDADGKLEDFLRVSHASFQPLTPRGLIRAELEAYDVLVIGGGADQYYDVLRDAQDRLREFVRGGGEIIIFGQSFGWPHDLFDFSIYPSESITPAPARLESVDHPLLIRPYTINADDIIARTQNLPAYPAIIGGGIEIISAGELGSYLKVSQVGDGHVIYCGLPLLDMAAALDVDAIHLVANILNFGHGN